jgi:hypothetical protein
MLQVPELACRHEPGEGSAQSCAYVRAVQRVRAWAERAEHPVCAHRGRSPLDGELWLLFAEVQTAYDRCPDHIAVFELRRETH